MERYKILQILNNNAVLSKNSAGKEVIITGKGIGFSNSCGNKIMLKDDYRVYVLKNKAFKEKFEILLEEIPFDCFNLAEKIVEMAQSELNKELNKSVVLNISDHLNFAIKQFNNNKTQVILMSEEVRLYYPKEYEIGSKALELVNNYYHISLPIQEASSIAFHIINAEYNNRMDQTNLIMNTTKDLLQIIESNNLINNKNSYYYNRLIVHIKYFVQRIIKNDSLDEKVNSYLIINKEADNYETVSNCIEQVNEYLLNHFNYKISDTEKMYLIMHISVVRDN